MNDWNIQTRAHTCQACGEDFSNKQVYHTVLFDLRHEIERLDVCERCWKTDQEETVRHRKGFVSHWRGVYEAPPPPKEVIRKENAESLLRNIVEAKDPKHAAASYILAVMLERKRLLKVKEEIQREGERIFVYENPKTGDVFTIPDPKLQLNQLDAVQREVAALLEHGFHPSPPDALPTLAPAHSEEQAGSPDFDPAHDVERVEHRAEPEPAPR
jgi:hypothetical protein